MYTSGNTPLQSRFSSEGPSTNSPPLGHHRTADHSQLFDPSEANTDNDMNGDHSLRPPIPATGPGFLLLQRNQRPSTVSIATPPTDPSNSSRFRNAQAQSHTYRRASPHGHGQTSHARTRHSTVAYREADPAVPVSILSNNHQHAHGHHHRPGPSTASLTAAPQPTDSISTPAQTTAPAGRESMVRFFAEDRLTQPWNPYALGEDYFPQHPGRGCSQNEQRRQLVGCFLHSLNLHDLLLAPTPTPNSRSLSVSSTPRERTPERRHSWQSEDGELAYRDLFQNLREVGAYGEELQDDDIDLDQHEGSNGFHSNLE